VTALTRRQHGLARRARSSSGRNAGQASSRIASHELDLLR